MTWLLLDCQTTGVNSTTDQIIELAWSLYPKTNIESHLVQLDDGGSLKPVTTRLTGLTADDFRSARPMEEISQALSQLLRAHSECLGLVIHYAQFETAFLKDHFNRFRELGIRVPPIFCSQKILKALRPDLPSHTLKAAAGHLGLAFSALKRSHDHVQATALIWRFILEQAPKEKPFVDWLLGLTQTPVAKKATLKTTKKKNAWTYRVDSQWRLSLPKTPGIYRMLNQHDQVLYVGKAKSLYHRINSYYRGQKGRDRKKLEMPTQTWRMETEPCATELEALLLERKEINRLKPPYNVLLKQQDRPVLFFNRDFSEFALQPTQDFRFGPVPVDGSLQQLQLLHQAWRDGTSLKAVFPMSPYEEAPLRDGYQLLLQIFFSDKNAQPTVRQILNLGLKALRLKLNTQTLKTNTVTEDQYCRFLRLSIRAAQELKQARALTRLLNADYCFLSEKKRWRRLSFKNGQWIKSDWISDALTPRSYSVRSRHSGFLVRNWADVEPQVFSSLKVLMGNWSSSEI